MKTKRIPRMGRRVRCGFSLLEMVIVLGIIALILAAVTGVASGIREMAKITATEAGIHQVTTKLVAYEMLAGQHPTEEQGLLALVERPTTGPVPRKWQRLMPAVPRDAWRRDLGYRNPGAVLPLEPEVLSAGGDGELGTADDISSQAER
jgi:general secretion pathway protein G